MQTTLGSAEVLRVGRVSQSPTSGINCCKDEFKLNVTGCQNLLLSGTVMTKLRLDVLQRNKMENCVIIIQNIKQKGEL